MSGKSSKQSFPKLSVFAFTLIIPITKNIISKIISSTKPILILIHFSSCLATYSDSSFFEQRYKSSKSKQSFLSPFQKTGNTHLLKNNSI